MTAHDKAKNTCVLNKKRNKNCDVSQAALGANVDNVGGKLCRHALLGYAANKTAAGQLSAAATKISAASCRHQPTKERAGYLFEIDKQQLQYPGSSWKRPE